MDKKDDLIRCVKCGTELDGLGKNDSDMCVECYERFEVV